MTIEEVKKLKIAKVKCFASLMFHTRYFFVHREQRKFVVNHHHEAVCEVLEATQRGELTKVMINIAPRYGKTDIAVKNYVSNSLALNASAKFIHLSYSDDLALDNSEAIKDIVNLPAYQQLFGVRIKAKSDSKKKWYTEDNGGVYATAAAGQVTGFGAGKVDEAFDISKLTEEEKREYFRLLDESEEGKEAQKELEKFIDELIGPYDDDHPIFKKQKFGGALIIDDPIKPEDADSEVIRERVNQRFDSTIRNRVNSRKTPIIIIMQRLHEDDLCGHLQKHEGYTTDIEEAKKNPNLWYVLSCPVIQEDENGDEFALWPFKHTLEELKDMQAKMPIVFGRQYMMNPQPKEGLMYSAFRTYKQIPVSKRQIKKAYVDTADKGTDYLCSIAYHENEFFMYVTDVVYTQDGMETTEPQVAKQLTMSRVERAKFESNNGGEGFKRNVEKQARLLNNKKTTFISFHQSDNKEVRIFSHSAEVTNLILMPEDWEQRWPVFAKHVKGHLKAGKNAHDDAADVLTGMVEDFGQGQPAGITLTKEQLGFL